MDSLIISIVLCKYCAINDTRFNSAVKALGLELSEHPDKTPDTEILALHLVTGKTALKRFAINKVEEALIAEGVL